MTKTSGRLREKRPQVASHFRVSDVKMKALNDPLPPHHPGSPPNECGGNDKKREFRYYSLDLSKLQRKTEQQQHHQRPTTPSNTINPMTWAEKNEDLYPSVSNETRRLLREVANIRMQYRQKTVESSASELPGSSSKEEPTSSSILKSKRPRKVANFALADSATSADGSSRKPDLAPNNLSSLKPDVNILQQQNSLSTHHREKAHKNRIVTHVPSIRFGISSGIDSEFSKPKAEESEKLQASPLNHGKPKQSFDSRSKKPENNAPVDDSPQKPELDKTFEMKPWRKNMKRSPSKEKSSEVVAENLEMTTKVDGGNNASKDETPQKPEIDKTFEMRPWRKNIKRSPSKEKSNEGVADVNETTTNVESGNNKPWRQNMKKSTSTEGEKKPSPTVVSCHSRQRPHDHERVKKFMKVKRHKAMADRKVKDQEAKKKKAQVQERLLALEAYRKTQGHAQSIPQAETNDELVLRLRKKEEEEKLKCLLVQLTDEMRTKHNLNGCSIPQNCEMERSQRTSDDDIASNEPSPVSKSSSNQPHSAMVTNREVATSNCKTSNNAEVSSMHSRPVSVTEANPAKESMREQVERLRLRENNIAEAIKSCDPELVVTDDIPKIATFQRPPDIVMPYFYPKTASTPASSVLLGRTDKPDAFNFMSSARRKFEAEALETKEVTNRAPSPLALSEGPISLDSISIKSSSVLGDNKEPTESLPKSGSHSKELFEEEIPVRDDETSRKKEVPPTHEPTHGEAQVIPEALHLRFQAELNQFESIQEAERQINQISRIRDVVGAKSDAATMAAFAESLAARGSSRKSSRNDASRGGKETRAQFEARMRTELHELFNSRMADLMKNQMRATKMTFEAAQMLASVKGETSRKSSDRHKHSEAPVKRTGSGSSSIPEDIKTLMSQAESEIPEILSVVEATDKSSKEIQRSIQSAIRELSMGDDNSSKMSNITEEIAEELSEDTEKSKRSTERSFSEEDEKTSIDSTSSTWFTGNIFMQHLEDQRVRDRQQYAMIKKRDKMLTEKVSAAMEKLQIEKDKAAQIGDELRLKRLAQKEKKVRKYYRDHKEELGNLRYTLQVAEKERKLLLQQHKKLASLKGGLAKAIAITTDEDDDDDKTVTSVSSSLASSSQLLEDPDRTPRSNINEESMTSIGEKLAKKASKMDAFKKKMGAATLKAPLSPKKIELRRRNRHSSAESDDSVSMISQGETVSSTGGDQSDLEIRVHALKEELSRRMKTAAKLKKEQKLARRERLKVQEDTLKKQIEVYDNLIMQTKAEMIEAISPPPTNAQGSLNQPQKIVQPQIKIPRQQSMTTDHPPASPTLSTCSLSEAVVSQHSISVDESESTDTIIVSPQKPATPSGGIEDEVPPTWPEVTRAKLEFATASLAENNCYSDDFTSSSCRSSLNAAQVEEEDPKPKPSEKTVDAICGHLLESIIEDTFNNVRKRKAATEAGEALKPSKQVAQQKPTSPRSRPQDMMHTTFDLSSESSDEDGIADREVKTKDAEASETSNNEEEKENIAAHSSNGNEEGDFIDDDFGLSIRREYEILRQQQLRIEEEINNIQKEKIPDKPPPPYTPPPASPSPLSPLSPRKPPPPKIDSPRFVPSSKEALTSIVKAIVKKLVEARKNEKDLILDKHLERQCVEDLMISDNNEKNEKSTQVFVKFIFDLVKDLVFEVHKVETESQNPPWMWQKPIALGLSTIPKSEADLFAMINREVMVAFNYEKRAHKENMIIRWSQKRRDRVDQVLVRELHAEEVSWTNYEDDEVKVKDDMTDFLIDALITDTARAFSRIISSR